MLEILHDGNTLRMEQLPYIPCILRDADPSLECSFDICHYTWTAACRLARGVFCDREQIYTNDIPAWCMVCGVEGMPPGYLHCGDEKCELTIEVFCRASYGLWCLKEHLCLDMVNAVSQFAAELTICCKEATFLTLTYSIAVQYLLFVAANDEHSI